MNVRLFDEVEIPRRKREIYTKLEERKMWYFFASELRAGNDDAVHRRPRLWKLYEDTGKTTKKMFGLESHFRKYMLPRIHMASIPSGDMFLLLRFFKIRLNDQQKNFLERRFGCDIDCDEDNSFRRARISIPNTNNEFTLPTDIEEGTILRQDNELQSEEMPTDEVETIQHENVLEDEIQHVELQNNEMPTNEVETIQHENVLEDEIQHVELQSEKIPTNEVETIQHENELEDEIQHVELQSEEIPTNEGETIHHENELEDEIQHAEKVELNKPQIAKARYNADAKLKEAFIKGALNVLDRKVTPRLFLEPFLWKKAGKYEKYARGIDWLVGEENDAEKAYSRSSNQQV